MKSIGLIIDIDLCPPSPSRCRGRALLAQRHRDDSNATAVTIEARAGKVRRAGEALVLNRREEEEGEMTA